MPLTFVAQPVVARTDYGHETGLISDVRVDSGESGTGKFEVNLKK